MIEHGKIILDLATTDQVTGGGTLAYLNNEARNVLMTLVYTITQTAPLKLRANRGALGTRSMPAASTSPAAATAATSRWR
ncbi:MAG TPA: hypothetical protein VIL68_02645 [Propionibacteriaceae bacterium]